MKITIAMLDKKGCNAVPSVMAALKSLMVESDGSFGLASPSTFTIEKNIDSLQSKSLDSSIVIGDACSITRQRVEPRFEKLENATLAFEGRIYSPIQRESIVESISREWPQIRQKAVEAVVRKAEGDYSLIIAEPNRIVAARDPIGVQPLYYGENANCVALASNRKALWRLGIAEPLSFPPGQIGFASCDGFEFKPFKTLDYSKPRKTTLQKAAVNLERLLECSVRLRLRDVKEVAVAFSGGLDSSVIAFLAKKCGVDVHLTHVSLRNHPETAEAKKAAEEMKLPINVHLFGEEDVAQVVSKVVELIEEPDPVKAAIGIPFYWVAEKTAEAGFKVLLAGQGADELFGGYQRYVSDYLQCGAEKARRTMFTDVKRLHESNIERDEKICSFHDVELRLPFASYQIAEFATSLPIELKIERQENSLRKLVLRKAAENMGLPESVTIKPKKAIQYATGINDALKKTAKKHKTTINAYINRLFIEQRH